MTTSHVIGQVIGDQIRCTVKTPKNRELTLSGQSTDSEPVIDGDMALQSNGALITNLWSFAKLSKDKVSLSSLDEQKAAEKQSERHRDVAVWIADLVDDLTDETRTGWCSSCISKSQHQRVKRPVVATPVWLCESCGSPTTACFVPQCENMATNGKGLGKARRFCAEHRHEIPSFERARDQLDSLGDYKDFLRYDKPNYARLMKVTGFGVAGIALAAPIAVIAAPALGGAIGVIMGGYSGAAATSFGLALLGGGSLAAGGLGMAGGTMVITALGAAIGGGLSASITSAYVQQDKSFHIEMLKGGAGTPIVVCNGFMSEEGKGWGEWKEMITERYPESPVYRVHWGAKELKDLGFVTRDGLIKQGTFEVMKRMALKASKMAVQKVGPLMHIFMFADLLKNPWHVAKNRADKTGVVLADLLSRTRDESFILVGHSLGARAITVAAEILGTKHQRPRIQAVHLLGNAIGAEKDWGGLMRATDEAVYNYHSKKDDILGIVYRVAQGGQKAAGHSGFVQSPGTLKNIYNIDVADVVAGHSDYPRKVKLRKNTFLTS